MVQCMAIAVLKVDFLSRILKSFVPRNKLVFDFFKPSNMISYRYGPHIPTWEYILNGFVVLLGIIGAVVTIRNVLVSGTSLKSPCFLSQMHVEHKFVASDSGHSNLTHCWLPDAFSVQNHSHFWWSNPCLHEFLCFECVIVFLSILLYKKLYLCKAYDVRNTPLILGAIS